MDTVNQRLTVEGLNKVFSTAEIFCTDVDVLASLDALLNSYAIALAEQFRSRFQNIDDELARSVWLDSIRWSVVNRIAGLRKMRSSLWKIGDLFTKQFYNPWCNLCVTLGRTCKSCPLVVYDATPFEKGLPIRAENYLLLCYTKGMQHQLIEEAVRLRNEEMLVEIVRTEIKGSSTVRVWESFKTNPEKWRNARD